MKEQGLNITLFIITTANNNSRCTSLSLSSLPHPTLLPPKLQHLRRTLRAATRARTYRHSLLPPLLRLRFLGDLDRGSKEHLHLYERAVAFAFAVER